VPSPSACRVVVLISGRGTNLQAIIDATRARKLAIELCAVVSNEPDAEGVKRAHAAGVPTQIVDHRRYRTRIEFEQQLMACIDHHDPALVVLAGFMRLLGAGFIDRYHGRLINIHPSLLPAFPGLRTHERALAARARCHGATVHFVTRDVDSGPIIAQAAVPVLPGDTVEVLAARVRAEEHRIYPLAIGWFAEGRLTVEGNRVLLDGAIRPEQGLVAGVP